MIKISIIVPCYNSIGKIHKCINSIKVQSLEQELYEVVFIDDKSTDGTFEYLQYLCENNLNWSVHQLEVNSGSPSRPRNIGVSKAVGEYIYFLDSDDEVLPESLNKMLDIADANKCDIVRGALITLSNGTYSSTINRLSDYVNNSSLIDKQVKIISHQSPAVMSTLIRSSLLTSNNIMFNENIRVGEDYLFMITVISKVSSIEYLDIPIFVYSVGGNSGCKSSTETYGAREISNLLIVWSSCEKILQDIGLSFYKLRLRASLKYVIEQLIKFYTHDINVELFTKFSKFINDNWKLIKTFEYPQRVAEVVRNIHQCSYDGFLQSIKPNLLIAGYDLKFIAPMYKYLKNNFNLKIDEWDGHNKHNEKQSQELLAWADIVFCEWMLGNAVWYSKHIKNSQKLFIRVHRFELTRPEFYNNIDFSKVNRVIAVSPYFVEKTIQYTGCPRSKMALLNNFVDSEFYQKIDNPDKVFNLGIIGILPSKKGYLRALEALAKLRKIDARFNLSVFGKMPHELSWIKCDKHEMAYFERCENFISENNLSGSIKIHGFVDIKFALKDIGFILSTSEREELFEACQVAPADGFAAGNQAVIMNWSGAEYVYPKQFIVDSVDNMVDYILKNLDYNKYKINAKIGYDWVLDYYSVNYFYSRFLSLVS